MIPAAFPEANAYFGPPSGMAESQCSPICAYHGMLTSGSLDGSQIIITAWKPEPHELKMLNEGHPIFLTMVGGLPPHMVTTDFNAATHPA